MTDLARQNIRLAVSQADALHGMEESAARLEQSSVDFHRSATRVRRMMCVRSWKMLAVIAVAVLILLAIIIGSVLVTRKSG